MLIKQGTSQQIQVPLHNTAVIQGVSGRIVNILGGCSMDYSE